ncbi:MAG: rhodanese-like domain-containing protein [Tabrizicola sp.]
MKGQPIKDAVRKDLAEAREVCPTTSQRLLKEGALLVDAREPAEVAAVGFAGCDAVNIPLSQFEDRWQEVPRDRDVILACAVGERSLKATYFLMYQGYDRVMNMNPGIGRWVARGFPITGSAEAVASSESVSSCCGGEAEPQASACCGGETGSCC